MVSMSFDTEDPPEQPPPGCADPLLWRVSHALHQEHRWEPGDRCLCGDRYPCNRARLAERGLVTSCTRSERDRSEPDRSEPGEAEADRSEAGEAEAAGAGHAVARPARRR